jgi:hypothetical protein
MVKWRRLGLIRKSEAFAKRFLLAFFNLCFISCASFALVGERVTSLPNDIGAADVRRRRENHPLYLAQGENPQDNGGNELFVDNGDWVYFSGNDPYKSEPLHKALWCRTLAHVVLGDGDARQLIAAYKVYVALFKMVENPGNDYYIRRALAVMNECTGELGTDNLLNVDLRFVRIWLRNGKQTAQHRWDIQWKNNELDLAIRDWVRYYFTCEEMEDFCYFCTGNGNLADEISGQINGQNLLTYQFRYPLYRAFSNITHTERMFLFDYKDRNHWPRFIFSKKAMCADCEDAMVRAWQASGQQVYVISEIGNNSGSYEHSPVKKCVIP